MLTAVLILFFDTTLHQSCRVSRPSRRGTRADSTCRARAAIDVICLISSSKSCALRSATRVNYHGRASGPGDTRGPLIPGREWQRSAPACLSPGTLLPSMQRCRGSWASASGLTELVLGIGWLSSRSWHGRPSRATRPMSPAWPALSPQARGPPGSPSSRANEPGPAPAEDRCTD